MGGSYSGLISCTINLVMLVVQYKVSLRYQQRLNCDRVGIS